MKSMEISPQTDVISNVNEGKRELRKQILMLRNQMTKEEHATYSEHIAKELLASDFYKKAKVILPFVSYGSEVDTREIIETALRDGKTVCCPRVVGEDMFFFHIQAFRDLECGYKGILEPGEACERFQHFSENLGENLLLMPGAVFDRKRSRIGYGKGFYDRFLSHLDTPILTVALAFSLQVLEEIPTCAHDMKPMVILTEQEWIVEEGEGL